LNYIPLLKRILFLIFILFCDSINKIMWKEILVFPTPFIEILFPKDLAMKCWFLGLSKTSGRNKKLA